MASTRITVFKVSKTLRGRMSANLNYVIDEQQQMTYSPASRFEKLLLYAILLRYASFVSPDGTGGRTPSGSILHGSVRRHAGLAYFRSRFFCVVSGP
jgi:hypothetical protein